MTIRATRFRKLWIIEHATAEQPADQQPTGGRPVNRQHMPELFQPQRGQHDRGQTTAEYALVLLAAGSIAMLVVGWAQGNDAIGALFDTVLSRITSLMA